MRKIEKKLLVCIDSDGCAFNSMDSKHRLCFGPQMMNVWPLQDIADQVLEAWNYVNLYSATRAVNRFKGLALTLKAVGQEDWKVIDAWTRRAGVLSNVTLQEETDPALRRALAWSLAVNEAIAKMPLADPFEGVKEAVIRAAADADIVVVSSTNPDALAAEWSNAGLMPYVSRIMSHRDGPKAVCIAKLLEEGYRSEQTIMLGDALGDYLAAKDNGAWFYPICPRREAADWRAFHDEVFPLFAAGAYKEKEEQKYLEPFLELFQTVGL